MAPKGAIFLAASYTRPSATIRANRVHKALVFRQRRDGLPVLIVELQLQRVEIGALAFRARGLRDRGNALLLKQPFQRHLRRAGAMLAAD